MENFLRGHVHAFQAWAGSPRVILHDNLRSAVLERRGNQNPISSSLSAGVVCPLPLHRPALPGAVRKSERPRRTRHSLRARILLGRSRLHDLNKQCNRQALLWRDQVAHQRPGPGDDTRTVAQAFAEEQPRLLPLPLHPFDTDLILPIRSAKTIYVRFDLNDYSIPPEAVRRPLTLLASDTWVRILDGTQEIARHRRSFDRHQPLLDPAHQQALLQEKRKAFHSTPTGRLAQSVPESETLLDLAFARGESAGSQTAQLLKLLDLYGAAALRRAIREALERDTPRASSVAFLLRRRQQPTSAPPKVDLSRHPEAQAIDVQPHNLETYDELAHHHDDDDSPQ